MTDLLTVPFRILQSLHTVAISLDPSCIHMQYPTIRQILTHLDNSKDVLALSYIKTKTHWTEAMCLDFYNIAIECSKEWLLLRASVSLMAKKESQLIPMRNLFLADMETLRAKILAVKEARALNAVIRSTKDIQIEAVRCSVDKDRAINLFGYIPQVVTILDPYDLDFSSDPYPEIAYQAELVAKAEQLAAL